jgi:microcystin-dependent protein
MAEHTTANYALPYPGEGGKVKVGNVDIQELAERIDTVLFGLEGGMETTGALRSTMVSTAPPGWLDCYGQEVSQAAYPALYALLKAKWGAAASGNFRLPNMQGRFAMGSAATYALGTTEGAETVTLTGPQSGVGAHRHTWSLPIGIGSRQPLYEPVAGPYWAFVGSPSEQASHENVSPSEELSALEPHTNMPPYFYAHWIVKT